MKFSRPFECAPPGCNLAVAMKMKRANDRNGAGEWGRGGLSRVLVFPF
jgi:hypothetical protein